MLPSPSFGWGGTASSSSSDLLESSESESSPVSFGVGCTFDLVRKRASLIAAASRIGGLGDVALDGTLDPCFDMILEGAIDIDWRRPTYPPRTGLGVFFIFAFPEDGSITGDGAQSTGVVAPGVSIGSTVAKGAGVKLEISSSGPSLGGG